MFDPELFGQAMGEAIRKAVEPLKTEIAELRKENDALRQLPADWDAKISATVDARFSDLPVPKDGADGKDCDMVVVKAMIDEAVKAIPRPADGRDGGAGRDGKDCDMEAVKAMVAEYVKSIPVIHGKDGADGQPGRDGESIKGEAGEKGADGLGIAGALIDREGSLLITLSNGEVKNLGPVVGRDGVNGQDGIGLESFEMEYIEETHEVSLKASAAGRVKELRYPAGGIRPAGYWREGTKAKANEAWVHDGSLWIAVKDTQSKPDTKGDWIIAARKGRDGERGEKGQDGSPPPPIKLNHG